VHATQPHSLCRTARHVFLCGVPKGVTWCVRPLSSQSGPLSSCGKAYCGCGRGSIACFVLYTTTKSPALLQIHPVPVSCAILTKGCTSRLPVCAVQPVPNHSRFSPSHALACACCAVAESILDPASRQLLTLIKAMIEALSPPGQQVCWYDW
jgi:hypothetical protein